MQAPTFRGIARAYLMSITFWFPLALLMGFQNQPLDPKRFWSSLGTLTIQGVLKGLALAFGLPRFSTW